MSYDDSIKKLNELADRIDHEQLWRLSGMESDKLTPEQKDRLMAGVNLRRYASDLQDKEDAATPGRLYMRGFKLERVSGNYPRDRGCGDHEWHVAINRFQDGERKADRPWQSWLYTAKMVSDEVPRMVLLFENERRGMAQSFKYCSHSPVEPLKDNHLRCSLGTECRKCPYLAAIEAEPGLTNEAKDEAKAWTCATHILLNSKPDTHFEQFLRDKGDDAFDDRMIRSFAIMEPPEPSQEGD